MQTHVPIHNSDIPLPDCAGTERHRVPREGERSYDGPSGSHFRDRKRRPIDL